MQKGSWEERLKIILNEFYEGNMAYYRQHSNKHHENEEKLRSAFSEIDKLGLNPRRVHSPMLASHLA